MNGWFDIQTVKKMSAGLRESSLILFWTLVLAAVLTRLDGESESFVQWLGRYVYWAAHVGSGLLISVAVMALLQQKFDAARPNLLLIVVTGLIGAVLFTPLALLLDEIESQIWFKSDFDLASLPSALVQELSELAPIFIGMWLIVQLPLLAATKGTVTPQGSLLSSDSDALPVEPKKDLLSRLPPALGKDVVSVESDLNYVHVTTLQGRTMLLYSLRQAAIDLGGSGLLIHRSVWVAKSAITRVKRGGQQLIVKLEDGREIKVSRRREAIVLAEFGNDFSR